MKSSKTQQYLLVRQQAQVKQDQLAAYFQEIDQDYQHEHKQLKQLEEYSQEYQQKINSPTQWNVQSIQHYRKFYHQIVEVIEVQQTKIHQIEVQLSRLRLELNQQHQKIKKLDELIDIEANEQAKILASKEQKNSDELNALRHPR